VAEVVELRVHGVGGTPAEGLLGTAGPDDLVQVGGDVAAPFMARRKDPLVEGYVWGKLTSKGLLQPLWLLLLPFTLVNVAGWTHPPERDARFRRTPLAPLRTLIHVVSFGLTATYVLWLGNITVNGLLGLDTLFGFAPTRTVKIALAVVVLYLLVLAHLVVARKVQEGFEGFDGPGGRAPKPKTGATGPGVPQALADLGTPFSASGVKAFGHLVGRRDGLGSDDFWKRSHESRVLLALHVLVGLGAATWVAVQVYAQASGGFLGSTIAATEQARTQLNLGVTATAFTEVLLWLLLAMGIVQAVGWRFRPLDRTEPRFRFLAPMTAAATGVGLGSGFLYGLSVLVLNEGGRVLALGIAFGMAAVAWAAGALGMGVWLFVRRSRLGREARASIPGNTAGPGRELNGATPRMYGEIAMARASSDAGRNGDLVMTLAQAVFLVVGVLELRGWVRFEEVRFLGGVATLGHVVALGAAAAVLAFLVRRAYKPDQRRLVGILWDVLTFWPRRFHPLGVRPYAERAVPELQHRLVHHVEERDRSVILSAHSQGTVIAYAALVQDGHVFDRVAKRVALVTYGSPLWQLFAMAFPAYVGRDGFHRLRRRLFDGGGDDTLAWRSFYRRTDYIGKEVFADPALEEEVPDPAQGPVAASQPADPWPDPPRTPWVDLARHSFYNWEEQLKGWLERLRKAMTSG
jgi:hypothetical protein